MRFAGSPLPIIDITQRKRIEEALRDTEEDRRCMVELSPQIPWTLDATGNLLDISSRWGQLTGMSCEQARNLGWLEALHPEEMDSTIKALKEAFNTGKPIDIMHRVKTVNGKWKWLRARGSPSYGPSGKIVRWYGGCEDIDEFKEMEEALRMRSVENSSSNP